MGGTERGWLLPSDRAGTGSQLRAGAPSACSPGGVCYVQARQRHTASAGPSLTLVGSGRTPRALLRGAVRALFGSVRALQYTGAKANLFGISYPTLLLRSGGGQPMGRLLPHGDGFRLFLDRWPTKHIRGSHVPLVCCLGARRVLDGLARLLTGSARHHACCGRYSIMMILYRPACRRPRTRPVTMHGTAQRRATRVVSAA